MCLEQSKCCINGDFSGWKLLEEEAAPTAAPPGTPLISPAHAGLSLPKLPLILTAGAAPCSLSCLLPSGGLQLSRVHSSYFPCCLFCSLKAVGPLISHCSCIARRPGAVFGLLFEWVGRWKDRCVFDGWLVDWLVVISYLVVWLTGSLIDWWLDGWMVGWLVG